MQIIVLGMHRSGTSALARILNMMGCYFGSEDVMLRTAQDNPKGFWERSDVMQVNDDFLRLAGGSWWDVDQLDFTELSKDLKRADSARRDIILHKLDAHRPWFIKDPRLCLTLGSWLPALECPVFIHVRRSPMAVAQSLRKRNGIPLGYGLGLWEFYTRSLLELLGERPRITVQYEDLIQTPWETCNDLLCRLVASGVKGLTQPSRNEIDAFISPELHHFDGQGETARLAPAQQELLAGLKQGERVLLDPHRMALLRRELSEEKHGSKWAEELSLTFSAAGGTEAISSEQAEIAQLKEHIQKLEAWNAKQNSRVLALEICLKRLYHSRLLRGAAGMARLLGRTDRGLVQELKTAQDLLELDGTAFGEGPATVFEILARALANPSNILRLLHPRRLKNGLRLMISGREGWALLLERCRNQLGGAMQCTEGRWNQRVLHLIRDYKLPVSSNSPQPDSPDKAVIMDWVEEIRNISQELGTELRAPTATIIIPVHNQIRFTLACLHSIYINAGQQSYEVIIIDDASTDQTAETFTTAFPRVRFIRNDENLGFLRSCNKAASSARGKYIIFLNNDTVVLQHWLDELLRTFSDHPGTGLVGSQLIYPEGQLQEAGGIIFEDGTGWNYGRLADPADPRFSFARDVDYCSGASLAIDADLWRSLGGFDDSFAPAYYEDTDLAFRVREAGRRVMYQPCSRLIHFEGVSHGRSENSGIKHHQALNRTTFRTKWSKVLATHGPCTPSALPALRGVRRRILMIDAATPTPDKDSGSLDAINFMRIFMKLGFHVIFVPFNMTNADGYTKDLRRLGVECLHHPWIASPKEAIRRYGAAVEIIFLTRVDVAASLLPEARKLAPQAKIWFDTVDLHFLRQSREAQLHGSRLMARTAEDTQKKELKVAHSADLTILRSSREVELLRELLPDARLLQIPIMRDIPGLAQTIWEARANIVFVGGFAHPPNVDAVQHFVSDVWPLLRASGFPGRFIIVGSQMPQEIADLAAQDIETRGFVHDLSALFATCRLSVAPLRYGAGMKGKVISSLAHGLPCVASPIAAEGTNLEHGKHLLVAGTPEEMAAAISQLYTDKKLWKEISAAGLALCETQFSIKAVTQIIADALGEPVEAAQ